MNNNGIDRALFDSLNEKDKDFIKGFDWAVNEILNLFDNLDVYPEIEPIFLEGIADTRNGKPERVITAIKDWAEMSRSELIVSMLDANPPKDGEGEYTENDLEEV